MERLWCCGGYIIERGITTTVLVHAAVVMVVVMVVWWYEFLLVLPKKYCRSHIFVFLGDCAVKKKAIFEVKKGCGHLEMSS